MALLSKPGLIPLRIESNGSLISTQVNQINFVGAVTGSIGNFNDITIQIGIVPTASFAISSSYALIATTSSYSLTSTSASYASASTSASYAATASYVANASSFPFTGSALITGSLGITGSLSQSGSTNIFLQGLINQTTATTHVVTFNNATGQLFITASSAFGGGGGGGTPGGATNTIQFNNAGTFSGSNNFTLVGGNTVSLTGSLLITGSSQFIGPVTGSSFTGSFTGSLFGTSSWSSNSISSSYSLTSSFAVSSSTAVSSSYAVSSSFAVSSSTAVSSSFATSASFASTASYVLNSVSASYANSASGVFIASNSGTDTNYTLVFKNNSAALDNYHQLAADGTNGPYYNPSSNVLGGVGGITVSGSIGRFNTITGSVSITGSLTGSLLGTSSFATTASYALLAATFPYTGSAQITGSLGVTGSISQADDLGNLNINQEVIYLPFGIPAGLTTVVSKTFAGPASMFLDYQIISGSNQRTGTIIANFNSLGTPTSTYYETVTADIGNTSVISFSTVGTSPPYLIQATNIGPNPFTLKAILRYF